MARARRTGAGPAAVRQAGTGRAGSGRAGSGRAGRPAGRGWLPSARALCLAGLAVAGLAGLAGCSGGSSTSGALSCGTTKTAVSVPVNVKVTRGSVDCATALRVEQAYTAAVRQGELHGNGGGAPVTVDGWACQTYPLTQVLRTGNASECHTASAEVVAVLAVPAVPPAT